MRYNLILGGTCVVSLAAGSVIDHDDYSVSWTRAIDSSLKARALDEYDNFIILPRTPPRTRAQAKKDSDSGSKPNSNLSVAGGGVQRPSRARGTAQASTRRQRTAANQGAQGGRANTPPQTGQAADSNVRRGGSSAAQPAGRGRGQNASGQPASRARGRAQRNSGPSRNTRAGSEGGSNAVGVVPPASAARGGPANRGGARGGHANAAGQGLQGAQRFWANQEALADQAPRAAPTNLDHAGWAQFLNPPPHMRGGYAANAGRGQSPQPGRGGMPNAGFNAPNAGRGQAPQHGRGGIFNAGHNAANAGRGQALNTGAQAVPEFLSNDPHLVLTPPQVQARLETTRIAVNQARQNPPPPGRVGMSAGDSFVFTGADPRNTRLSPEPQPEHPATHATLARAWAHTPRGIGAYKTSVGATVPQWNANTKETLIPPQNAHSGAGAYAWSTHTAKVGTVIPPNQPQALTHMEAAGFRKVSTTIAGPSTSSAVFRSFVPGQRVDQITFNELSPTGVVIQSHNTDGNWPDMVNHHVSMRGSGEVSMIANARTADQGLHAPVQANIPPGGGVGPANPGPGGMAPQAARSPSPRPQSRSGSTP